MIVLEVKDVEVDFCLECSGVWLDGGELEELFGDPDCARRFVTSAAGAAAAPGAAWEAASRKCPICRKRMEAVRTASSSASGAVEGEGGKPAGVEIDRCPKGHGLWFDRGELEAVLKAFGKEGEQGRVGALLRELFGTRCPKGKET